MIGQVISCRGRILVVDQDEWVREFMSQVSKFLGLEELKLATTAEEALTALQESAFDLLITDLALAEHHRLLENFPQRFPGMRVLLMAEPQRRTSHWVYRSEVDVVVKPFRLDDVVKKIREAIHQKHRQQVEVEFRRLKQEVFRILR